MPSPKTRQETYGSPIRIERTKYWDVFKDDGDIPGGGAPVKQNIADGDLERELEHLRNGLTEDEKRNGVRVYERPARYPPQ